MRQRIAVAGGSVNAVWDGTGGQSSPGGDPERQRGAPREALWLIFISWLVTSLNAEKMIAS